MPKALCKQSKQLIASLLSYFERERDNGGPLIPLAAVQERVANALQICLPTVSSVAQTIKANELIKSPKRKKLRTKPVVDVDDFDQVAIRNVVYEMYQNKQHITRASLLRVLKERDVFKGGISSLGKVLKDIGFRWKKDDPRRGLMELDHIAFRRVEFLRKYIKNLHQEKPSQFVYLDETWIFENGTVSRSWQDDSKNSVKKIKSDGKRYIVLHAGNRDGFIPGASLIFTSSTKNPDYHGEMNQEVFLKWFEDQLLKNLEEPSIIVMDNASYHSTLADKTPNASWKKQDIIDWLTSRSVNIEGNVLKMELLQLVAQHKPPKTYVADNLAEQYGHTVLRLPPYHCIFNPIENVWGIAKTYYNKHIGEHGYGVENTLNMWQEALSKVTAETWSNCVTHAEGIIQKWWDREVGFDVEDIAPIIIEVNDEESDDTCDSD